MRFLLADDPGVGKTTMPGLLIKELIISWDLERCLIIAPGSLTEQWQNELKEKFDKVNFEKDYPDIFEEISVEVITANFTIKKDLEN